MRRTLPVAPVAAPLWQPRPVHSPGTPPITAIHPGGDGYALAPRAAPALPLFRDLGERLVEEPVGGSGQAEMVA